jgi:hypothetical protein
VLFVPSARDDIIKYFKNSFLKFKETGDTLFFLTHVTNDEIGGQIEDGRDFKLYLDEKEPYEVDYILPHKSFFQFGEHCCMLQRIPARQYHRGITEENTQITYRKGAPSPGGTEKLLTMGLSFEVLKAFVQKKKFFSLTDAMKEPVVSCAMSPRMMYVRAGRSIYIDFVPVARVDAKTKNIFMIAPIFRQEVLALLTNNQEQHLFTVI